jgi:hypothetical protein
MSRVVLQSKRLVLSRPTVGKTSVIESIVSDSPQFSGGCRMRFASEVSVRPIVNEEHNCQVDFFTYYIGTSSIYENE